MKKNISIAFLAVFLLGFSSCSSGNEEIKAELKVIKEDLAKTKEDLAALKASHEQLLKTEVKEIKEEGKLIDDKMDGPELN